MPKNSENRAINKSQVKQDFMDKVWLNLGETQHKETQENNSWHTLGTVGSLVMQRKGLLWGVTGNKVGFRLWNTDGAERYYQGLLFCLLIL